MKDGKKGGSPYLEALQRYIARETAPFHTPGHKQGRGFPAALQGLFPPELLALDLDPPLLPAEEGEGVSPSRVLAEAERSAAGVFGARETLFLTNGTTAGILAGILAVTKPGREIIVARPMHRSVMAALILSGARPVYWEGEWSREWGIPLPPPLERLASLLERYPGCPVFLTTPSYHGLMSDLPRVVSLARTKGSRVLVDEAHGPHLRFLGYPTAMSAGADLAVQSTHKLLSSLVGSSMLHLGAGRISGVQAREALALVQSTSPSPLLLLSLEGAVRDLVQGEGVSRIKRGAELAREVRERIRGMAPLRFLDEAGVSPSAAGLDPCKLAVRVDGLGLTGPEAMSLLAESGVQPEMAGANHVLFIFSPGDDQATSGRLLAALDGLKKRGIRRKKGRARVAPSPPPAVAAMTPREAFYAPKREVPLKEAAGRVAGVWVDFYPPGAPVLVPGEVITPEILDYLGELSEAGVEIRGFSGPGGENIKVADVL